MARINLLPWRQEVRERKNKEFMTLVVAVILLSLLGAFAAWSYFNNQLTNQQTANETIKQENASLDRALAEIETLEQQRDDIVARMKVIQDLQGRRPVPVRVWDDIARLIPAQMYLNNMKREGEVITFTGQAGDNTVISNFIRALDSSEWLQESAVVSIQENANQNNGTTTNKAGATEYAESKYLTFVVTTKISQNIASPTASTASAVSAVDSTIHVDSASPDTSSTNASTASVDSTASSASSTSDDTTTASTASTAKE